MKSRSITALALLLVCLLLAGCGSKNTGAATAKAAYAYPDEAAAADIDYGMFNYAAEESAAVTAESGSDLPDPTATTRKIIKNADISLQTREYDAYVTGLEAKITAIGGYVESSSASGNSYYSSKRLRSMSLTARIPAEKLDSFLSGMAEGANILSKSIYTNDVTANYVDSEARLKALKTERDTLMGLLEKADKMEDIILIYERISDVNYQIESYESKIRSYDDKISYSTVYISIQEVERETVVAEETAGEEIARRIKENLQDIGTGLKNFCIGFVSALPYILLYGAILTGLFFLIRGGKKRQEKRRERREKRRLAREERLQQLKELRAEKQEKNKRSL